MKKDIKTKHTVASLETQFTFERKDRQKHRDLH